MRRSGMMAVSCGLALALGAVANADILVYRSNSDNGFFTPFNPGNANTGIRYGDSGWVLGPSEPAIQLSKIVLKLATFGGSNNGTTNLKFTFNDGDPSGLVFGTSTQLYQTTINNVQLLSSDSGGAVYFDLEIPLPGVSTLGGFNNVGFSIETQSFNFDGQFGFQVSSSNALGFSTTNASFYNGTNWSLFSFGGPAQYAFDLYAVPAPASAALLGLGGLAAMRRRR